MLVALDLAEVDRQLGQMRTSWTDLDQDIGPHVSSGISARLGLVVMECCLSGRVLSESVCARLLRRVEARFIEEGQADG